MEYSSFSPLSTTIWGWPIKMEYYKTKCNINHERYEYWLGVISFNYYPKFACNDKSS